MPRRAPARRRRRQAPQPVSIRPSEAIAVRAVMAIVVEPLREATQEVAQDGLAQAEFDGHARADGLRDVVERLMGRMKVAVYGPAEESILVRELERAGLDVNRRSLETFRRQAKSALGLDVIGSSPNGAEILNDYVDANTSLIKTVPERHLATVERIIRDGWRAGRRWEEISVQLIESTGVLESNAIRIAIDQVGKLNAEFARDRQTAAGVDRFIWRTSQDGRVRAKHRNLQGKQYEWGKGHPTERMPGWPIRCFPGDTPVAALGVPVRLFRREYVGDMIDVHFGDRVIRSTPNHPIHTARGVVPAKDLQVGDQVIEISKVSGDTCGDHGRQPTLAELWELGEVTRTWRLVAGDFHGDASTDDHVDVVHVDRRLLLDIEAKFPQAVRNSPLANTDKPLSPLRGFDLASSRNDRAPGRFVGGLGPRSALLGRRVRHSREHGPRTAAQLDANALEPPSEYNARNSLALRDLLERGSASIELREVVDVVRCGEWRGHVFNLETSTGMFATMGVIVGNCRCHAEPVFEELPASSDDPFPENIGWARTSGGPRPRSHRGPAPPLPRVA